MLRQRGSLYHFHIRATCYDPGAHRFRIGDDFARLLALTPRYPALSALRSLYEFAFVQFYLRVTDHQPLHEERIAEPEDGSDIVVLGYAIQHHCDRSARAGKKVGAGAFGSAQL
jgi:hypothetical protein